MVGHGKGRAATVLASGATPREVLACAATSARPDPPRPARTETASLDIDAATLPGRYLRAIPELRTSVQRLVPLAPKTPSAIVATALSPSGLDGPTSSPRDAAEEGRSAMIPGQFDYVRPGSLGETLQILKDREGEAKLLSGGYSLIPLIKLRLAQPALLVDMRDLTGLDGIGETDDYLVIGAKATHRQIHENEIIQARYPGIVDRRRRHRRPAGPQLGHDRRLGRPRGSGFGLAGPPHRDRRHDRLHEPGGRAHHPGPRVLPRYLPDGHRAHRSPHPGPAAASAQARRRCLREARAQGRRLRHGRRGGHGPA